MRTIHHHHHLTFGKLAFRFCKMLNICVLLGSLVKTTLKYFEIHKMPVTRLYMLHNKWNIIMGFMFLWIKWKPSNIGRFGLQLQSPLQHRTTTRFQDSAHPPYGFTGSQYGWKAHRDRCFGSPPSSQSSLPIGTNIGREIFNGCIYHICSLGIFLPQVIPPTYVGS